MLSSIKSKNKKNIITITKNYYGTINTFDHSISAIILIKKITKIIYSLYINSQSNQFITYFTSFRYVVENQYHFRHKTTTKSDSLALVTVAMGNTDREQRAFDFLDILVKRLEQSVVVAKEENAFLAAKSSPAHGTLI